MVGGWVGRGTVNGAVGVSGFIEDVSDKSRDETVSSSVFNVKNGNRAQCAIPLVIIQIMKSSRQPYCQVWIATKIGLIIGKKNKLSCNCHLQ